MNDNDKDLERFFCDVTGFNEDEGGYLEINKNFNQSKYFTYPDFSKAKQFIDELVREKHNVFFGPGVRKQPVERIKSDGKKSTVAGNLDVKSQKSIFLDVDGDGSLSIAKEKVKSFRDTIPDTLWPTYIVKSGHGYHLYWCLKEPTEDFDSWSVIQKSLLLRAGGDPQSKDLSRFLRVPGTVNFKDRQNPISVKIVKNTGRFFNLLDFDDIIDIYISDAKEKYDSYRDRCPAIPLDGIPGCITYLLKNEVPLGYRHNARFVVSVFGFNQGWSIDETIEKLNHISPDKRKAEIDVKEVYKKLSEGAKYSIGCKEKTSWLSELIDNKITFCNTPEDKTQCVAFRKKDDILQYYPNVEVLGELKDGEVLLFSKDTKKSRNINLSRMTYIDVILLAGKHPGDYLHALKQNIAFKARENQVWRMKKRGQGIWLHDNKLLIVNGGEAFIWNDNKISQVIESPIFEKKYEIQFQQGKKWIDFSEISTFDKGDIFDRIYTYITQWTWKSELQGKIVTALIYATPFQHIWPWRPHVYLTGRRNVGKTTFIQFVQEIYSALGLRIEGKVTEASLRQEIRNDLLCVNIDEFEKVGEKHREQILKCLRVSNKGGTIIRGSPNNEPIHFDMNHLVWLASIEVGLRDAADQSRFIILELKPFTNTSLKLPDSIEMKTFFKNIIFLGLYHYQDFLKWYNKIITEYNGDFDSRTIECYAVPLSILAIVKDEDPFEILNQLSETIQDIEEDEEKLIENIINSKITIKEEHKSIGDKVTIISRDITIGDLIHEVIEKKDETLNKFLKMYGISVTEHNNKPVIALQDTIISDTLLKQTHWSGLNIKDLLLRINNAFRDKKRFSGKDQRAVCIPLGNFPLDPPF